MPRASFYEQPTRHRFGQILLEELSNPAWQIADIAVAWVRQAGARQLAPAFRRFLRRGGVLRITVGIDIENTSREGLAELLRLLRRGDAGVFVHHNEASGVTFHPKVYCFSNAEEAKLIVGSNNLTGGGLSTNTEAALESHAPLSHEVIRTAQDVLRTWRDPATQLARPLTRELLRELISQGYVFTEARIRQRRVRTQRTAQRRRRQPLFAAVHVPRPPGPRRPRRRRRLRLPGERVERILLMRVRKASETDRPTQTQLPKAVYSDGFFAGVDAIVSARDERSHRVHPAYARGIINTLKLEIPEMRDYGDPVLRFQRGPSGITYEAYDAASAAGRRILAELEAGRGMSPPETMLTRPSRPANSTWWRFIQG